MFFPRAVINPFCPNNGSAVPAAGPPFYSLTLSELGQACECIDFVRTWDQGYCTILIYLTAGVTGR